VGKEGVRDAAERGTWHGHLQAELGRRMRHAERYMASLRRCRACSTSTIADMLELKSRTRTASRRLPRGSFVLKLWS